MKVGTDGVLLGAWCDIREEDKHSLDIGCGTALIALMMAQRSSLTTIDAVEIDSGSAEQATENISASKWSQRVNIHNIDILNFKSSFKYDSIVCNPPFFNDSLLSPDKGRTTARHTVSLSFEDLIKVAVELLAPTGSFSLILPTTESESFENLTRGHLHLWRKCLINSRIGDREPKRIMSEYRLTEPNEMELSELSIREAAGNSYSQEYKNFTSEFYLKF